MTCVAAVRHEGEIWIGADSAGVAGFSMHLRADEKVFRNGEFVMGFTTSFRMGQLLRWKFNPPVRREGVANFEYMATEFVDAARKCFKDGGFAQKKDERESAGCFIVGLRGQLFYVADDYQVGELLDEYMAVGCGQDLALGSLFSTEGMGPEERIETALQAAARFSAGVRPPFHVIGPEGKNDD